MKLKSICDRQALSSLHRWRLRLKEELRYALRRFGFDMEELGEGQVEHLPDEVLEALRAYDALSVEIVAQNCARQCALIERFKGETGPEPERVKEMTAWWWQRY